MTLRHYIIPAALLSASFACNGASPLSLDSCMAVVMERNISLAAERLNIPIARAEERAAKVFNDPTLGVEYANNDDHRMQMGQSVAVELGYTFSPGKRGARKNLAESERELSEALFDDYLRQLRLQTAASYHEVIKATELYNLARLLSESMAEIAEKDSIAFSIGQIKEVDAMSTHISSHLAIGEEGVAATDLNNARLELASLMGDPAIADFITPDLEYIPDYPDVNESAAIAEAIERRADLKAALKNVEVARRQLKVEGAERNLDFDVALGYNYNTEVRNELAPAPKFSGITVGVTIPLKFSNSNKGALTAAKLRREQAELQYRQAELEVKTQVMSAIDSYRQAKSTYRSLDNELLKNAGTIYNSYLSAYHHGDVSLVELLDVRTGYTDILKLHIEARCNLGVAYANYLAAIGR